VLSNAFDLGPEIPVITFGHGLSYAPFDYHVLISPDAPYIA
jgi:hypothetical protein